MNLLRAILVLSAAWLGGGAFAGELPETLARVKRSVVALGVVSLPGRDDPRLLASGFVVSDGNHAVTTLGPVARIEAGASKQVLGVLQPETGSHARFREAAIVARDSEHDLCVVRFPGPPLPALRLGTEQDVREGEVHAFTGFPNRGTVGLHTVTHRALIAAISPNILPVSSGTGLAQDVLKKLTRPYDVFQLDATPFPGNSGSPLYEVETGRVVGVVNSVFVKETKEIAAPDPSAISYAVPAIHVRRLLGRAGLGR